MSSPLEVDVDEAAQPAVVVGDPLAQLAVLRRRAPRAPRRPCRPSTSAAAAPPAASRSWVGSLTVTAIRPPPPARSAASNASTDGGDLGDLERAAHGVDRLQAVAGDAEHDALVGADVAALGELGQRRRSSRRRRSR